MIRIHKEGKRILMTLFFTLAVINMLIQFAGWADWIEGVILLVSVVIYGLVLQFFRNPRRFTNAEAHHVIAPADGKIVAIEEIDEQEYFKGKRL